jgi:lysine-specific demethylase 8
MSTASTSTTTATTNTTTTTTDHHHQVQTNDTVDAASSCGNSNTDDHNDANQSQKKQKKTQTSQHKMGYLAQHNLFQQIPSLQRDIVIPDYVCASPHFHEDDVVTNAWFGPAGTVSPLHHDNGKQNLLCQVVGFKYVRLYHPRYTNDGIFPDTCMNHSLSNNTTTDKSNNDDNTQNNINSSNSNDKSGSRSLTRNTSRVLDVECTRQCNEEFRRFGTLPYWETILCPGEMLYIPAQYWHYVRSLTPSFSVNFWFT